MTFRRSSVVAVLLAVVQLNASTTLAFTCSSPRRPADRRNSMALGVTAEEIVARAREKVGVPADEEPPAPKLFEDSLLLDMKQAITKMDRRCKDGPGSLSILEAEELRNELARVLVEMKQNEHKRPERPTSTQIASANSSTAGAPAVPVSNQQQPSLPVQKRRVLDTSQDEGPAYDGTGGMGQPRGTINTYVIEGMDEMEPEEYQKALQQSILDRQAKRRAAGLAGNRATSDYLSALTGEKGLYKN